MTPDRGPVHPSPPTGEQHHLIRAGPEGEVTATVAELAASLRTLRVAGAAVVQEYPDHLPPPSGAGIVLVPWANRVGGARWVLDGAEQLLDVTEPDKGNATHGLLRNTGYTVVDRSESALTLAATVFPQHGYPFHLGTTVRYELAEDGVRVTHTLLNLGSDRAPVAVGCHPYLRVGDVPVEDLRVTVRADTYLEVDERQVPVAAHPVTGTDRDLRDGARVGEVDLDTTYTDLHAVDGIRRHRLEAPDGTATELWADAAFGHVQVYTKRGFPRPDGPGLAVALEPMTAAPDALNNGAGLVWLGPGDTWSVSWGLRLVPTGS